MADLIRWNLLLKPTAPHASADPACRCAGIRRAGMPRHPRWPRASCCWWKGMVCIHAASPGARVMASPIVRVGDPKPVGFHPKTGGCHHRIRRGTAGWVAGGWAAICAIWARQVEVTCVSPVPRVSPAGGTIALVALKRRVGGAGDQHHPDLAYGDVTPQESCLGHARGLVPAVPTPASLGVPVGPPQGHLPARLGTGRGGWGPIPPSPSEPTPELSSPQLLPFAGSVPRFAALSRPSAEIPTAGGGVRFAHQICTHGAGPMASPGSGLGAFCSPFRSRRFNFGANPFQRRARLPARLSAEISHP